MRVRGISKARRRLVQNDPSPDTKCNTEQLTIDLKAFVSYNLEGISADKMRQFTRELGGLITRYIPMFERPDPSVDPLPQVPLVCKLWGHKCKYNGGVGRTTRTCDDDALSKLKCLMSAVAFLIPKMLPSRAAPDATVKAYEFLRSMRNHLRDINPSAVSDDNPVVRPVRTLAPEEPSSNRRGGADRIIAVAPIDWDASDRADIKKRADELREWARAEYQRKCACV